MIHLADYLETSRVKPWKWGNLDCCFFGGNWIAESTGRDPMAPYRGIYDTARQAARLIRQRGGLVKMVDAEMTRCGFERTTAPDHGDIAVVDMPDAGGGDHCVAGASVVIRHATWWVGRGLHGIMGLQVEPLAIWRVLP